MIKTIAAQVKAAGPDDGLAELQFDAYASVFGNLDSYRDVVVKGAFTDSLKAWKESGNVLPCLWGHDMADPESNIGSVISAKEDDHGLLVRVQLDPESSKAATVYRLLKGRRVSQMSFAYDVLDGASAHNEEHGDYFELRKLGLYEVSVVPIGANPATEVLAVKRAAAMLSDASSKGGRTLSAKNESELRTAYESLGRVLGIDPIAEADQPKASGTADVKADEPAGVKADERPRNPSADAWSADLSLLTLNA